MPFISGVHSSYSRVPVGAVNCVQTLKAYWIGYEGRGPDPKVDGNHTNQKTFTIYPDGKIYVKSVDALLAAGGEHGGASGENGPSGNPTGKSTFIHPINANSQAGFTLATNYSMDALNLYPRGGGVPRWLLQWGQDTEPDPVTKIKCLGLFFFPSPLSPAALAALSRLAR
jgi:hypothetical protein